MTNVTDTILSMLLTYPVMLLSILALLGGVVLLITKRKSLPKWAIWTTAIVIIAALLILLFMAFLTFAFGSSGRGI